MKYAIFITMAVMIAMVLMRGRLDQYRRRPLTADRFLELLKQGQVLTVTADSDGFQGTLKGGEGYSVAVPIYEEQKRYIDAALARGGVTVEYKRRAISEGLLSTIIMSVMFIGLFVVFWMFMARQAQVGSSQAMAFGRSRHKRPNEGTPKVTFADVAGVEEAKNELMEVVDFLRNSKRYQALGARIPRGVLLLGPPGCGKTLLARAVAGEAGVPFFHISGSDFVEMFVGVGASRVRDLFDQAKANRPCIVFIDEIDAVGRQRFAGVGGGHDEREQTLNQLLVEMDGFDPNAGVILLAATNRPDVLDPALLRPGRFDRRIIVDAPDRKGREMILKVHSKGKPLGEDVDMAVLARRTPGFTGADLANAVNEAALLAARRSKTRVDMADCEDAIDRVLAGPERKSRVMTEHERKVVACHEVGHALLAELLPHSDPLHKVSITQRGLGLGYTMQLPTEDRYLATKGELLDEITVALGGRVTEELAFAEVTTGAANDLERATDLARRMVTEYGMTEKLGPVTLTRKHGPTFLGRDLLEDRNYSDTVAGEIDREIRQIIDSCYAQASQILSENRERMDRIVTALLERETLDREDFRALMEGRKLPEAAAAPAGPPAQPAAAPRAEPRPGEQAPPPAEPQPA
jgi:cell division protease FtsH